MKPLSPIAVSQAIPPLGDRPLRGAMIGAGNIAAFQLRAWQQVPGVEVIALCDRQHERAIELGRPFGLDHQQIFEDVDELFDQEPLDFVDIATPPHVHAEHVNAAAERGVHVLCQKPFTTSLDEARRLIASCAVAGIRCVVNENWRWRRWYRQIGRSIEAGTIGTPRYARFTWHADDALPGPDGATPKLIVQQPYTAEVPRLIVFEWGIHLIDVMRFLFGDIRRVNAQTARHSLAIRGEDVAVVLLTFASGVLGVIDVSWGTPVAETRRFVRGMVDPFFVEGTSGSIELDPFDDDALVVTSVDRRHERCSARNGLTRAAAYQECFTATQRHFIDRLRDGRAAENEAADNWNTLATVFAAYESAETGQMVDVPPLTIDGLGST